MVLLTGNIKNYKLFSLVQTQASSKEDFIFLSTKDSKLYVASDKIAASLDIILEDVKSDEKEFIFNKQEFLHIISMGSKVSINSKYEYELDKISGKFEEYDKSFLATLSAIKSILEEGKLEERIPVLVCNENIIEKIEVAQIFTNPDDKNVSSRGVHINNNMVASSSLYRIYYEKIEEDVDVFLHSSILKFLSFLREGTEIFKAGNRIYLRQGLMNVVFAGMENVSHLPINEERFVETYNAIVSENKVILPLEGLQQKIDFILFYASKNINKRTNIIIKNNTLSFKVDTNEVTVDVNYDSDKEINFFLDLSMFKDILYKINKNVKEVTLYENPTIKLVVVEFSEKQYALFAKINE